MIETVLNPILPEGGVDALPVFDDEQLSRALEGGQGQGESDGVDGRGAAERVDGRRTLRGFARCGLLRDARFDRATRLRTHILWGVGIGAVTLADLFDFVFGREDGYGGSHDFGLGRRRLG